MSDKTQKKLLLLGGGRYLIPAIKAAHKLGVYVITADYLPNNYAHKFSDEYVDVSIIDKKAVLRVAQEKEIDGIMSFACDPGVVPAAYVAEKMGLPMTAPYNSVCVMQNKGKFREFLYENGFNTPRFGVYNKYEDLLNDINNYAFPLVIKPVDSSGSKGVKKINAVEETKDAVVNALSYSLSGFCIVEEFIEMDGSQSGSDSFVRKGNLDFVTFDRQFYDATGANPFAPVAMCYPTDMSLISQEKLKKEIQRAVSLLRINTTILNIECRIGRDGKPYIMELSPRAGGNRVPEVVRLAYGVDIIEYDVKAALGMSIEKICSSSCEYSYARVIIRSNKNGIFKGLVISDEVMNNYLVETDIFVSYGEQISIFNGASDSIGLLILKFPTMGEAEAYLSNTDKWLYVRTD